MSFLDDLLETRSAEDPTTPLNLERLAEIYSGQPTDAGIRVTNHSAYNLSIIFGCIRAASETVGTLPFGLYRRLHPKGRERQHDDPRDLLLREPNPEMLGANFWETLISHAVAWGGGFAEIQRHADGEPAAFWPLLPDRTRVMREDGVKFVRTKVPATADRTQLKDDDAWRWVDLPMESVLHIPGFSFDGLNGYSILTLARQVIGWGLATEKFSARFFSAGTHADMILKHPGTVNAPVQSRLRDNVEIWNQGLGRTHRLLILEEGMEAQKLGIPPEEAQFVETERAIAGIVARYFRMPPHKVGLLERATFSNIEHQAIEFVTDVVTPWCVRVEQATDRALFKPSERREFFTKLQINGLLRGDIQTRFEAYAKALDKGWMNRDEVRELEDMNPIPDGSGQAYTIQLAQASLDQVVNQDLAERAARQIAGELRDLVVQEPIQPLVGEVEHDSIKFITQEELLRLGQLAVEKRSTEAEPSPPLENRSATARQRLRQAFRPIFLRVAEQLVRRDVRVTLKAIKRAKRSEEPMATALGDQLRDHWEALPAILERDLLPALQALVPLVRGEIEHEIGELEVTEADLEPMLRRHAREVADLYVVRASTDLATAVVDGNLEETVRCFETERPPAFAADEVTRAESALTEAFLKIAAYPWKRWKAVCTDAQCQDLDGRSVAVGKPFDEGVHRPPRVAGCRCLLIP